MPNQTLADRIEQFDADHGERATLSFWLALLFILAWVLADAGHAWDTLAVRVAIIASAGLWLGGALCSMWVVTPSKTSDNQALYLSTFLNAGAASTAIFAGLSAFHPIAVTESKTTPQAPRYSAGAHTISPRITRTPT